MYKGISNQLFRHLNDMPNGLLARLTEAKIFFGHKSLGDNIIDGIRDLATEHNIRNLCIKETKAADQINHAMLAHAPVGRNLEPESKISEFRRIMEGGLGEKVDIAFFKFCYVDIVSRSNTDAIFAAYNKSMEALKARFPEVIFLHITAPLCALPKTAKDFLKANVKRVLGHSTILNDNYVRAQYNELLRERYSGKEPLFDLAEYEALGPDELRHIAIWRGYEVPVLVQSYTDDSGHLNTLGRQHVAEQLLMKLETVLTLQERF